MRTKLESFKYKKKVTNALSTKSFMKNMEHDKC